MKGLVIREPWIGMILRGEKTWEMRSEACHLRETIALIRKGSGLVVGTARVVDCRPPLTTRAAFARAEPFHRVPPKDQATALKSNWTTPWVLAEARPLASPVRYEHRRGAVKWVILQPETIAAIRAQLA